MSSLNLFQRVLVWMLHKKINWEYLKTKNISSKRKGIKRICLWAGIAQNQIESVEDFVINKYYMRKNKQLYVSEDICRLCRGQFLSPQFKKQTKKIYKKINLDRCKVILLD